MILEVAHLDVKPGQSRAFEAAFAQAQLIISSMPGYAGHELRPCIENPSRNLLPVHRERLEDYTQGFRGSPEYRQWEALLHHFYEPFPAVEHYGASLVVESGAKDYHHGE